MDIETKFKLAAHNWGEFQHYKDRLPPWIKLHRTLLDNRDFICLPTASRALAPCLWLVCAEQNDGVIHRSLADLQFKLRISWNELASGLKSLIEKGFFVVVEGDASDLLALCKQLAVPEERRDREQRQMQLPSVTGAFQAPGPVDNPGPPLPDPPVPPSEDPPPDRALDTREQLWAIGVPLLTQAGVRDTQARTFIGRMCKQYGDAAVLAAIEACALDKAVAPVSWITASLQRANPAAGRRGTSRRFGDFWLAWPQRENKQDRAACEGVWKGSDLDEEAERILADVKAKRGSQKWLNGFVEAPLKYLENRRWEDGSGAPGAEGVGDWRETVPGVNRRAVELGMKPWDETVQWSVFKASIIKADEEARAS